MRFDLDEMQDWLNAKSHGESPVGRELIDAISQRLAACAAILAMQSIDSVDQDIWNAGYDAALQDVRSILATHGITKDS